MARAAGKKKSRRTSPKPGAKRLRRGKKRLSARSRTSAKAKRRTRATSASPKRKRAATKSRGAAKKRTPAAKARVTMKRVTVVRRPRAGTNAAPAPVPPAFSAQRAGASAREELLFELQRARASVKAATQGLSSANAERAIAPGKWSIKEIVLHLGERDRVRLEEFGRALGGQPRSWAGIRDEEQDAVNEVHLAPLRTHNWDEAVRRMDSLREQLLHRLSQFPAQPDDVWQRGHAFGDMMWGLPKHDRHHADQIKLARLGELVPVED